MTHFPDKLILKIPFCEITFHGNIILMSAKLAHQKADKHLCVVLHRKVRIRLHPSAVFVCGIIMCTISQLKILDTSVHIVLSATRVVRNQCLSHILRYCLIHAAKMRISECRARSTFGRLFPEGLKKLVWAMPSVSIFARVYECKGTTIPRNCINTIFGGFYQIRKKQSR